MKMGKTRGKVAPIIALGMLATFLSSSPANAIQISPPPLGTSSSTSAAFTPAVNNASSQNSSFRTGENTTSTTVKRAKSKAVMRSVRECGSVRNTVEGKFRCVKPKTVKMKVRPGTLTKPTLVYDTSTKKWVRTPYLWNKKANAYVLRQGMAPWVESLNSASKVSSVKNLRFVDCADGVCETSVRKGQVKSDGNVLVDGKASNYVWDTRTSTARVGVNSSEIPSNEAASPEAPTGLKATPGDGRIALSWTPPTSTGASDITGYQVRIIPEAGQITVDLASNTAGITGLTNGTQYTVSVAATNTVGTGPYSNTIMVTPQIIPGVPTNVSATALKNGTVELSWTAPTTGAPLTGYQVTANPSDAVINVTGTKAIASNMMLGRTYFFTVSALNSVGAGTASAPVTATPLSTPGAVTDLRVYEYNESLVAMWEPPTQDGGSEVTSYVTLYSSDNGTTWIEATASENTMGLTELENGTRYYVSVAAVNLQGTGTVATAAGVPQTTPDAPAVVSANPQVGAVEVMWDEPEWTGGGTITHYIVEYSPDGGTTWERQDPQSSQLLTTRAGRTTLVSGTSMVIPELENGREYLFRVVAVNNVGESEASEPVAGTPREEPGTPRDVTSVAHDGWVELSWSEPEWDGGESLTGYEVRVTPEHGTVEITGSTARITGLENATTYEVHVHALNTAGASNDPAIVYVTPYTTPDAPENVTLTASNQTIDIVWDAPVSHGGSPITNYTVSWSPGHGTLTETETGYRLTGLENGRAYYVKVAAVNARGASDYSSPELAIPYTIPDTPTGLAAVPNNGEVRLTWNPPAWNGGKNITSYRVNVLPAAGAVVEYSGTSAVVSGLSNGNTYFFSVAAVNDAGSSVATPIQDLSSIPRTVPDAPENLVYTVDYEKIVLEWDTPGWNGGQPIINYAIGISPETANLDVTYEGNTATITGFDTNTTYTLVSYARNVAGYSEASTSVDVLTPPAPIETSPEEQSCMMDECVLSWSPSPGSVSYDVYRDGVLLETIETVYFVDSGTLEPETVYVYTIVPRNSEGTAGAPVEITVTTLPDEPTILSGPDYYPSTGEVVIVTEAPNEEAEVSYTTTYADSENAPIGIAQISDSGSTGASDLSATTVCDDTTCTVTWSGFADKLGTKWFFSIIPTNPAGAGPGVMVSQAAPDISDFEWSIESAFDYCPIGYDLDMGDGTCREVTNYTYDTMAYTYSSRQVSCAGPGCPGSNYINFGTDWSGTTCPYGGTMHGGQCLGWTQSCCVTETYRDATPAGWEDTGSNWRRKQATPNGLSDSGTYWYRQTGRVYYDNYRVNVTYAWNDNNARVKRIGDFVINDTVVVTSGVSSSIGYCPGTVTVTARGIGGTTTGTLTPPCGVTTVPDKPVIVKHATGQFRINNYNANLDYILNVSNGTVARSGDIITLSDANATATVIARAVDAPRDSDPATMERKAYTYTTVQTGGGEAIGEIYIPKEEQFPQCPAGWNGPSDFGWTYVCHLYAPPVYSQVKNPTPSGYLDSTGEWWRVY